MLIDTWNTWFFRDLSRLRDVWPGLGQNRETVSELFVGFLRYFSETFKFDENVICCRRLKPVTRLEKMWTGKKLAIEGKDPERLKFIDFINTFFSF